MVILAARILIAAIFEYLLSGAQANTSNVGFIGLNLFDEFMIVVVLAPIFETLIFQFGVIELFGKIPWIKNHQRLDVVAIISSGVIFSFSHFQSSFYIFSSFVSGLLYSGSYIFIKHRFNISIATILIMVCHCLYNLFVFLMEHL
jgi:hypothetical protein